MNTDTPTPQTVTEQTLQRLGIQWGTSEWIRVCNKLESDLAEAIESREFQLRLNVELSECEKQTYAELNAVTEQRDEARRLAEKYRNLSCDSQEEADETLLPWENNQQTEP